MLYILISTKALNQVSYCRLLEKMKQIGLDQFTVSIIGDFLSELITKIEVVDALSEAKMGIMRSSTGCPRAFVISYLCE